MSRIYVASSWRNMKNLENEVIWYMTFVIQKGGMTIMYGRVSVVGTV